MESKKYSMDLAGRELTLEFGKYCEQAAGSVWVHLGDTVVMVNATMAPTPVPAWTSSRWLWTWRKSSTPWARFPAASSSVKAVRPKRRP